MRDYDFKRKCPYCKRETKHRLLLPWDDYFAVLCLECNRVYEYRVIRNPKAKLFDTPEIAMGKEYF